MEGFHVFGIGNPLIDYLVQIDDTDLNQLQLQKGGMHLIDAPKASLLRELVKGKPLKKACGDSTANTLAAMACLGSKTIFLGKAGNDDDGLFYENNLIAEEVHPLIPRSTIATGSCTSFISNDGERTLATYLGACLLLEPKDLDLDNLKASKCLHLTGYSLEEENLKNTSLLALDTAKKNGILVSLDLADSALIERIKPELKNIMVLYASVVFANEKEASSITGSSDSKEAAQILGSMVKTAVVKVGDKGSFVCHNGEVIHIPAFEVKAIDSTGAGDCYNAGFLHGILHGYSVQQSAMLGSFVAAKVVSQIGARLTDEAKQDIRKKAEDILKDSEHSRNMPLKM